MQISHQWLKEISGVDWPVEEMANRLTLCGTACEYIEATDEHFKNVVVGKVIGLDPVEGASKIQKATVDLGSEKLTLICGAPNVAVGQLVPVATLGAVMANGMEIKKVTIRGVESSGMICSQNELGVSTEASGIWVLPDGLELGTPLADALDYKDFMLTFEVTPNRGDSLSAIGIARDIVALAGVEFKRPEINLNEIDEPASNHIKVSIDSPEGCPRYAARVIRNIKVGQSPWWLQKRLLAAGIRPISNAVDITNFVMLECGQPLHAFDFKRFGSDEVVVRMAEDKEQFTTLDGKEHELTSEVLLITNGKRPVAVGGVMGGLDSEVEDDTTDILLEAAYFDPMTIRRGRRHLVMATESSQRFEKGADPNGIEYAINRAASLFAELCGGEVLKGAVDCYPNRIEPHTVSLRPSRCNQLLGSDVASDNMKQILVSLQYEVSGDDPIEVTVPTFRTDIDREVDLIEEVGRIYGYDNIPNATRTIGPLYTPANESDKFRTQLRSIITSCGFDEILLHGLTDEKLARLVEPAVDPIRLTNAGSADLNVMRTSLLPSTLTVASHNIAHRNLDLALFEIGKVYLPPDKDDNWVEPERLMLLVTGQTQHGWRDKPIPYDFYHLTGVLERLRSHFRWPEFEFAPMESHLLDSSASFAVKLGQKSIGYAGLVNMKVARAADIKQPIYYLEIALEEMMQSSQTIWNYQPLPVYPAAPRDLAMVVDDSLRAGDIIATIKKTAGDLAERVDLFDLYTGKQIATGKKSIAISIVYRSPERSLSTEEVDERQAKVVAALKSEHNAEIRDK
jgi:phenylalanyl-tRNA synthetase beta chain